MHYEPVVRETLSRKNVSDKLTIAEGARFIRFSHGVYLWKQYSIHGRTCDVCSQRIEKVDFTKVCCNNARARGLLDTRIGNGYRINDILEARFLVLAELDKTEIKYMQFGEGVARSPYCISVDHAWKTIVIAIRGTEGFDDVVADLRMVPASMEECGAKFGFDGTDCHAHAGMLENAEWIYEDLQR